jgi:hypothetical protein
MGYEFGKEREPIFLGLHCPSGGGHAATGRWGGALDAWKAGKSHEWILFGGSNPLS